MKCGTKVISYRILRKANKHTYLAVKGNTVEVRANRRVSEAAIADLVRDKADWIVNRLQRNEARQAAEVVSDTAFVWGKEYRIVFGDVNDVALHVDELVFPRDMQGDEAMCLANFYAQEMRTYLSVNVPIFAERMQLFPTKVSVRHTTSQWGSCSLRNALSFSLLAAQLSPALVDYLIVHELAHIRHKHHQASFWALVEKHCPSVNEDRRAIRAFEKRVMRFK